MFFASKKVFACRKITPLFAGKAVFAAIPVPGGGSADGRIPFQKSSRMFEFKMPFTR